MFVFIDILREVGYVGFCGTMVRNATNRGKVYSVFVSLSVLHMQHDEEKG